jgi:hypothetical protein
MYKLFVVSLILMVSGSLFAYTTPDRSITAYMTGETPTIDGVEEALWKDVIAYSVARPDTSTEFCPLESGDDYAGWFKVTWDPNNLYFFFNVIDDTLYMDPNSGDNDKIELFFDADASGGLTKEDYEATYGASQGWWFDAEEDPSRVYDENCSQWVFELDINSNITATQGPGLSWPGMEGSLFPTDGIVWDVNMCADGRGYTMEIKIPFESLKAITPAAAGDQLGMNIQINDFDVPGERAFYDWIEDYPNASWRNPAVFGLVTLSDLAPGDEYAMQVGVAGANPVIDGILDEIWQYAMPRAVVIPDTSTEFCPLESGNDYSGWFRAMWDADNLYFFFNVIDDTLYMDPNSGDNDKIELFFDADASGGLTQEEYEATHGACQGWWFNADEDPSRVYDENCSQWVFELDINSNITATQGPGLSWPGMEGSLFPTDGIVWDVNMCADGRGYTMEIKIPFESLKAISPAAAGDQLGMNIQVNDFDAPGERAFYDWRHIWDNASWRNPANFGILVLDPMEIMGIDVVAHWLFDDSLSDATGNGHDGVAMNGASVAAGALLLDGNQQYVEVADDPAFDLTDAFTITAVVQMIATDDRRPIITKEQNPDGSRGWNCWIQDGEPRMQLMDGVKWADTGDVGQSKLTVTSGTTLEAGMTYHLAFVYDSAGPEQIYVDGVLQVSEDVVTGTLHTNEQPVRIGAYIWDPAGYQKYFAGLIDDIRVYDRVLTQAEIEALINAE